MGKARVAVYMLILFVVPLLLGCAVIDALMGLNTPEEVKQDQEWQQNQIRAAQLRDGVDRKPGNYRLTFSGEPPGPWGGSFEPVNRTPAMLEADSFTASETNQFSSGGDPKTAVQVKDTWVIEATRTGSRIEGTAKFVRWRDEQVVVAIIDEATGETSYRNATSGEYPALTVTWEGTLRAVVAEDGTIAGTVAGTFSNSEGFSEPFQWEFVGDPTQ